MRPKVELLTAFYGDLIDVQGMSPRISGFLEMQAAIATRYDISLSHMACMYITKVKGLQDYTLRLFKRSRNLIQREIDRGNVKELTLYSYPPQDNGGYCDDHEYISWVGYHDFSITNDLCVLSSKDMSSCDDDTSLECYLREQMASAVNNFNLDYGFIAIMHTCDEPVSYGIGFQYNFVKLIIEQDRSALGDFGCISRKEILRNVYPINYLSDVHLHLKVGNVCLRDWIAQEEYRGEISQYADGRYLWDITGGKYTTETLSIYSPIVSKVRKEMEKEYLFAYEIYRRKVKDPPFWMTRKYDIREW